MILEMLLTSSALILAVLLVRAVFGKKMGAGLRYGLWLLVLLRLLLPVAEHGAHLRKPRTVHSDSVILHLENHDILAEYTGHPDMSAAALVLDAVVERILHKRLERQLDDLIYIELLRNRNLIFQYIPVAELLDL